MTPRPAGGRAAAALRLRRYDVAAADAQHAAERDPGNCRAVVRGGRAQLGLRRPAEAASLFKEALQQSTDDRAAQARARELRFTDHISLLVLQPTEQQLLWHCDLLWVNTALGKPQHWLRGGHTLRTTNCFGDDHDHSERDPAALRPMRHDMWRQGRRLGTFQAVQTHMR